MIPMFAHDVQFYLLVLGILASNALLLVLIARQYLPKDVLRRLTSLEAASSVGREERLKLDATLGRYVAAMGGFESRMLERLDTLDLNQSKLLGHITGTDRVTSEMVAINRETMTSTDQLRAQLVNVATRLGVVEEKVRHIDSIVSKVK